MYSDHKLFIAFISKMNYFYRMIENRENIRITRLDSVFVLLILFFGLLVFNNSGKVETISKNVPVSAFITVHESSGISNQYIRLQIFERKLTFSKDNFSILAYNINPACEDKKTSIKVIDLQIIRQKVRKIPIFLLRYHLFPVETDEAPLIG
jgi:hypothetical protein